MTETVLVKHVSKRTGVTTDVSSAITFNAKFTKFYGETKQIPSGSITFDEDKILELASIQGLDDLEIYIVDGATTTLFTTALMIPVDEGSDLQGWDLKGYEHLTEIRRASGVHLGKTGTQLFKDLVDEYLPECTYDSTSIPDVADEEMFDDQEYNAKVIKDIFDTIAEQTERVWGIDENKVISLKSLEFADSGYTIDSTKVIGRAKLRKITGLWQTQVRVEGASVETQFRKKIDITDAAETEYELPYVPSNVKILLISPGENIANSYPLRGALEGTRRADDDGIEYTYKPSARRITFTENAPSRAAGDAIYADFTLTDQIVSEQVNPLAYAKYGLVTGPPEVNKLITTQTDADTLAQTLADARGEPKNAVSFRTPWDSRAMPGNSITLDDVEDLSGSYNVVELSLSWGSKAPTFDIGLDNINYRAEDTLKRLMNRVRQLEEKETNNSSQVKKTIPVFGNIGIEIYRCRAEERLIGNAFTFDLTDVSGMFDNAARYIDGVSGSGDLTFSRHLEVWNVNDKIKMHFNDETEWDLDNSTATLDVDAGRVTF